MPRLSKAYKRIARRPKSIARVAAINKVLTITGYVAYPLLLVILFFTDQKMLARCIVVPALGFASVTVLRFAINASRPYENGGPPPLIPKKTMGESFPSRHTFCMFMIAFTWFICQPIVGVALIACAIVLAYCRVALGVHYARDVVAAAIIAAALAALGYWPVFA